MAEKIKNNKLMVVTAVCLVGVLVFGSALGAFGAEFKDYKPPSRLDVQLYDWMRPNGSPSDGTKPDDSPTWQQDYPYRAFLFGGDPNSQGQQKHDSNMFVIYSKLPEIDLFTFEYRAGTKARNQTGYIRVRFDPKDPLLVNDDPRIPVDERDPDVMIVKTPGGVGVSPGPYSVPLSIISNYRIDLKSYFDFDFYYQCCGTLEIKGLKSIMSVPYPYILTCQDPDGSGGGSQMPSNPGGGSSGGGSSGGDSSGGSSSGGESSGAGDDPGGGGKPWTGDTAMPDYPDGDAWAGDTGDTGQTGYDWSLPSYGQEDVTGEASGYVELKPGGDGSWGPVEIKPGGNGSWGPVEIKPGGNGQSISDWKPDDVSQGLYNFGWW